MNASNPFHTALQAAGLQCEYGREDGIPHLSVWSEAPTMSAAEATRIAGLVSYLADGQVHFHELTADAVSFFVFEASQTYRTDQFEAYGVPVSQWAAGFLGMPEPAASKEAAHTFIDEVTPSSASGSGFIWARRAWFDSTARTGKWCFSRSAADVDALWTPVREAVRTGLVPAALVSTPAQAASFDGSFLVCVFTEDWSNPQDVRRVREWLRDLGVREPIGYKRDLETSNNVYDGVREWMVRD